MNSIILILLINTAIALGYVIFCAVTKNIKKGIACGIFILVTPIVGALCIFCSKVYIVLYDKFIKLNNIDFDNLTMDTSGIKNFIDVDVEKEIDKIPLNEAMLIADKKNRRKVLLEVLKGEKDDTTLNVIREATFDEDTEVTHYAIAFVTAATSRYRKEETAAAKHLESYPGPDARVRYINCLCDILRPNFFNEYEQETYIINLDKQIKLLKEEDNSRVEGIMLSQIVDLFNQLKNTSKVKEYVGFSREIATKDIHAAKVCLKYYYKSSEAEEFKILLKELKVSTLELDNEVLDWIRFYNIS